MATNRKRIHNANDANSVTSLFIHNSDDLTVAQAEANLPGIVSLYVKSEHSHTFWTAAQARQIALQLLMAAEVTEANAAEQAKLEADSAEFAAYVSSKGYDD